MFSNTNQQRLGCQICIQCILQNKESKFTFAIECRNHNCTNVPQTSISHVSTYIHPFTHPFNGPLSGTTQVSRYQKGKTNLDFTEARDSEWQWNPLGHMQVCISLRADNHTSTPLLSFFTGRMPFLPPNQQCQSTEGNTLVHT